MSVEEFCKTVLFGGQLADKLLAPESLVFKEHKALEMPPLFPGRPPELKFSSELVKKKFPDIKRIHEPGTRAMILHYFANHELLALELMALAILRFPDSELSFREGILRTMRDEQRHLNMYMARMQELGVRFGDFPVNQFFWRHISKMRSPSDYTVLMSLTFEQANLDFATYYRGLFLEASDEKSSEILRIVLEEEINHVSHGLKWFRKWECPENQNNGEWTEYCRLIKPYFSPGRARGPEVYRAPRLQAGFSPEFIDKLTVFHESNTRPPSVWKFFPFFEEDLSGPVSGSLKDFGTNLLNDLSGLLMFVCSRGDLIVTPVKPGETFVSKFLDLHDGLPGFIKPEELHERSEKISAFKPWGWSGQAFDFFRPLRDRLTREHPDLANLFLWEKEILEKTRRLASREWGQSISRKFLAEAGDTSKIWTGPDSTFGVSCSSMQTVFSAFDNLRSVGWQNALLKAPLSASGRSQCRIRLTEGLREKDRAFIQNTLKKYGLMSVEPFLNKLLDLSVLLETRRDQVKIKGITRFLTRPNRQYLGHVLGKKFGPEEQHLETILNKHRLDQKSFMDYLTDAAMFVGQSLREESYFGPAGIDAMVWSDECGNSFIRPIVEVNLRYTMGHIALGLGKMLTPGSQGIWLILDKASWLQDIPLREPRCIIPAKKENLRISEGKIESGFLYTNDPDQSTKFQSGLWVRKTVSG